MDKANIRFIKGIGMTPFGFSEKQSYMLAYDAISQALNDADMSPNQLDAIIIANIDFGTNGERQRHFGSLFSSLLKFYKPIIRSPSACASGGVGIFTAMSMGFDNILVVGCEKLSTMKTQLMTEEFMMAAEFMWEQPEGMIFPAQTALVAQQHFLKYGSNLHDLSLISYKNHQNGAKNPNAKFYNKSVSLAEIEKSPVVASPLRLMDCSISVDGASAVVLSKDKTDIGIIGSGMQTDALPLIERDELCTWNATKLSAEHAYNQAGISPEDIDIVEIHDAFSIVELISYEDLGFCEKGKGQELIRDGVTTIDGKLPVNTSGGLKAKGHPISATGIAQIIEITEQLRGTAGDRQVSNAKIGLTQNIGGIGGSVAVHVLKRFN
ncbi:MAG: thiolase family protein [Nanoarchaeota archaeon]